MKKYVPLALALAGAPQLALAQGIELAPDVIATGEVALQYFKVESGSDGMLLDGDVTLAWRSNAASGFSFGVEGTIDTLQGDDMVDGADNFWGSVVLGFNAFDLRLGAPRPVIETMAVMPSPFQNRALRLMADGVDGSIVSLISRDLGGATPGLSVQSVPGAQAVDWGVSYHQLDLANGDIHAVEAAVNYTIGTTTVFGKLQHIDPENQNSDQAVAIGAYYDNSQLSLGVEVGVNNITDVDHARLHAGYAFNEALSVTGDAFRVDAGEGETFYSMGVEYGFGPGAYIGASATTGGDKDVFDLTAGWRF